MDTATSATDIAEVTDALFKANLELVAEAFPSLHKILTGLTTTHTELVRVGDDDWDVEFRGNRFYGMGARAYAEGQIAQFKRSPSRMQLEGLTPDSLCHFSCEMATRLLDRIAALPGARRSNELETDEGWHLIVFGWGLGQHIIPLLEHTRAHHLIIIEPNIEMVLHSLRTFDWSQLIKTPPHKPLTIKWKLADSAEERMAMEIRSMLRSANVAGIDGSYYFHHYPNSKMDLVSKLLLDQVQQAYKGLGYIDDELRMIRNSYQNHSKPEDLIFRPTDRPRQWPIFILGSGPSLDAAMPVIKANADRAIIVACGTTLPVALKAGLKPDFAMILENGEVQYDWLSNAAADNPFGDTILFASNTVDRRLSSLFKRTVYFVRDALASTPIFSDPDRSNVLGYTHPTVGNTGVSFALHSGYREIYLFGMDLGARDADRHHAGDAPYNTGKIVKYTHAMNIRRRGNFGGTCVTDHIMDWGRDTLELTFRNIGVGKTIYNCSNGVYVAGATPKVPKSVSLPEPATARDQEIADLLSAFTAFDEQKFEEAWKRTDLENQVVEFQEKLRQLAKSNPEDPLAFTDAIMDFILGTPETACLHVYRGTSFAAVIGGRFFVMRTAPRELQVEAARILAEEFIAMIDRMADYAHDFLRGMKEHGHYEIPRL